MQHTQVLNCSGDGYRRMTKVVRGTIAPVATNISLFANSILTNAA